MLVLNNLKLKLHVGTCKILWKIHTYTSNQKPANNTLYGWML